MLLHPDPYAEVPKKPWNPMLACANPVNSASKMDQPEQPEAPEPWFYGKKFEVWTYVLFTDEEMSAKVRVLCVYNSPPWGIHQPTINDLATLWDVPILLQEKLDELDHISLLAQFLSSVTGKNCSYQVIIW